MGKEKINDGLTKYQRYYRRNKEVRLAYHKEWKAKNAERVLELKREAYKRDPERHRFYNARRWYGITRDQYDAMLLDQAGKCAICGVDLATLSRRPAIDHNHTTGAIRALLCNTCNVRVGLVENEAAWRQSVLDYIAAKNH